MLIKRNIPVIAMVIFLVALTVSAISPTHVARAAANVTIDFNKYENGTKVADFTEPYMTFSAVLSTGGLARAWNQALQMYSGGTIVTIALAAPASQIQLKVLGGGGPCAEKYFIRLYKGDNVVNTESWNYCEGGGPYKKSFDFDRIVITLGGPPNATQNVFFDDLQLVFPQVPSSIAGPTIAPTGLPTTVPTPAPTSEPKLLAAGGQAFISDLKGKSLTLLNSPGANAVALAQLLPGTLATITIGPTTVDGLTWWRIRTLRMEGWILSSIKIGQDQIDTLIPFSSKALEQTIADATRTIQSKPTAAAYIKRGLAQYNQRKYPEALADFAQAIKLKDPNAYYFRGLVASESKEPGSADSAIRDLTSAIGLAPRNAVLYYVRGLVHRSTQNYNSALADFARAVELNPRFAAVYANRGIVYQDTKNLPNAAKEFTQAVTVDPYYSRAYYNMAFLFRDEGDLFAARRYFDQAIFAEPKFYQAYSERGYISTLQQDYQAAFADFDRALQIDPNYGYAFNYRGVTHYRMGNYDAAINDFTRATQLSDDQSCRACAFFNLGLAYFAKQDYDKSVENYTRAIELRPNYAAAYTNRARAYEGQGNTKAAEADRKRAEELRGAAEESGTE